ncbi:MAG: hypothetical protein AB4426_04565 [Xenococcaceae cyanobacterium]
MTKFPNEDEKLVAFLRQHRPVPPPAAANFEEQLMMELVQRQPIPSQGKRYPFLWAVFSAIAAGLLLTWGGYRLLNHSPQIAADTDELETFLVNNWNAAIGETSFESQTYSSEADWLLLADPETDSVFSNP